MIPVAADIWHARFPPLVMPGGVRMPLASAVIRLPDRSLVIYSPGPFDSDRVRAIELLGEVRHLIAPSLLHHLFVRDAAARWPAAIVHAVRGLAAKEPDLRIDRELEPFAGLDVELVGGAPRLGEAVVFHPRRAARSCVPGFLVQHRRAGATLATRAVLALSGAGGGLRQSRLWRVAVRDRAAARAIDRADPALADRAGRAGPRRAVRDRRDRARAAAGARVRRPAHTSVNREPGYAGRPMARSILLVEDNPDDVELTLRAFERNKILNEVVVKGDGEEALSYLFAPDATMPALVLLDLKLPKVPGLEVLKRLRADERTRRLPVVVLTSSNEERDIITSYDLGANSFVRKPVDFAQFIEAARQLGMYWLVLNEGPDTLR